jgi:hypothetical protein
VHCFCAKDTVGAKVMRPSINATVLMDMKSSLVPQPRFQPLFMGRGNIVQRSR